MAKETIEQSLKRHTFSAEDLIREEQPYIELSPRLQELTGGIKFGSGILMSGKSGFGKTTTALHIAAKAQQQYDSEIWYLNAECRMGPRDFQGCYGFDADAGKFNIIQPEINETLYADDYINYMKLLMETKDNIVVVMDSLSMLAARDLAEDDITRRYQSRIPNILSQFGMVAASMLRKRILVVMIAHEIANLSRFSQKTYVQKGGNAVTYWVNYNMRVSHVQDWKDKEKIIGQINNWTCLKTASSVKNISVPSKFRYNFGVDEFAETLEIACELAIIRKKGGGNYEYNDVNLARGEHKMIAKLRENPELYQEISGKIVELINE